MKKCATALFLCLFFTSLLQGIELKPWYSRALNVQGILDYRFQTYPSVATSHKNGHYSSDDQFVDGSFIFVYEPYSIQIETLLANTKKRSFDWDNISLTLRYLCLDDNIGDPFSLTTGLTLGRAWREAVNDISSFHHGRNEAFFHVALGKQKIQGASFLSRWWTVLGIGTADRWTAWLVANAAYEWNYFEPHRFGIYVNSLWGCGTHALKVEDFGGYGPLDHRSVDIGIRYTYELDYYGSLNISYARRVYASNFPENTNQVVASYIYPFGPEANAYLLKAYSLFGGNPKPF